MGCARQCFGLTLAELGAVIPQLAGPFWAAPNPSFHDASKCFPFLQAALSPPAKVIYPIFTAVGFPRRWRQQTLTSEGL